MTYDSTPPHGKDPLAQAEVARGELYRTLGQLTERLNYAKRFDRAVEEKIRAAKAQKRDNPGQFFAGLGAVAVVAGVATWAIASRVLKNLR